MNFYLRLEQQKIDDLRLEITFNLKLQIEKL